MLSHRPCFLPSIPCRISRVFFHADAERKLALYQISEQNVSNTIFTKTIMHRYSIELNSRSISDIQHWHRYVAAPAFFAAAENPHSATLISDRNKGSFVGTETVCKQNGRLDGWVERIMLRPRACAVRLLASTIVTRTPTTLLPLNHAASVAETATCCLPFGTPLISHARYGPFTDCSVPFWGQTTYNRSGFVPHDWTGILEGLSDWCASGAV